MVDGIKQAHERVPTEGVVLHNAEMQRVEANPSHPILVVDLNMSLYRHMEAIEHLIMTYNMQVRVMIRQDRIIILETSHALPHLSKRVKDTHEHGVIYKIVGIALPMALSAASVGCSMASNGNIIERLVQRVFAGVTAQALNNAASPMSIFSQIAQSGTKATDESTQGDRQEATFILEAEKRKRDDLDGRRRDQDGHSQTLMQQLQGNNDKRADATRAVLN